MSQTTDILDHLKRHDTITPYQALRAHGCMRLAARIQELRRDGHQIETEYVSRGGKRWARYRLES